jgi:hypothetical protein
MALTARVSRIRIQPVFPDRDTGGRKKMIKMKGMPRVSLAVISLTVLVSGLLYAQLSPIYRFKGAQLPLNLKVQDKILEKGVYDLDFVRTGSPVLYFVRFMKRGKILGMVQGEELPYANGLISDVAADKTIPVSPTLKMNIDRDKKLLRLVFESGRHSVNYPMIRARFELPFVE